MLPKFPPAPRGLGHFFPQILHYQPTGMPTNAETGLRAGNWHCKLLCSSSVTGLVKGTKVKIFSFGSNSESN